MKILKHLIIFGSLISGLVSCHGQSIEMISQLVSDVLKNEKVPSVLSAITCWPNSENFNFVKQFSIPVQVNNRFTLNARRSDDLTNKLWYFIDLRCEKSVKFLHELQDEYFAHPYRWILLGSESESERLKNLTFLPDSNIILVNYVDTKDYFVLNQIYKVDREQEEFIHENFGSWNVHDGLIDLRETKILSRRRRNFRGKVLKASLILLNKESQNQLEDMRYAHIDSLAKTGYSINNNLIRALNASVEYKIVSTWGYGDMRFKEKLGGMMGHLLRNEVDMGATVLFMQPERVAYVEYLSVILPTRAVFIFRAPPLSYVSNIYYLPFVGIVWICMIALVLLCTFLVYLTFWLSKDEIHDLNVSDFLLLAIGTICQMGGQLTPKRLSGKMTTFVFCLALLFIYTSFTANIVALLQSTTKSIRTLTDLLNSNIELGVADTPYARYLFPNEDEPVRRKIYEQKIAPPNEPPHFMNVSHGVDRVRKGLFGFHSEKGPLYREIKNTFYEHEKCGLVEITHLRVIDPWYGIPKHSPYKEIFKVNLFKIRESGIQIREKSRFYTDRPHCSSHTQNFGSVRLMDCYVVLLVLCFGLIVSITLLAVERVFHYLKCFNHIEDA